MNPTVKKAAAWLHFKRACPIILIERDPASNGMWRPDVLGITKSRKRVEIEVKCSLQDFRQNGAKWIVANRKFQIDRWPWKYFFFVPPELVETVTRECPEWAGILTCGVYGVGVVKEAPINQESRRMSVKQCVRTAYLLSNQIIAMCRE